MNTIFFSLRLWQTNFYSSGNDWDLARSTLAVSHEGKSKGKNNYSINRGKERLFRKRWKGEEAQWFLKKKTTHWDGLTPSYWAKCGWFLRTDSQKSDVLLLTRTIQRKTIIKGRHSNKKGNGYMKVHLNDETQLREVAAALDTPSQEREKVIPVAKENNCFNSRTLFAIEPWKKEFTK